MRRFWRWLMHIIWATPEENERFSRVDDDVSGYPRP